ncbi:hypothetical protein KC19_VG038900 [Ceratodon purpureus]|uniref:Uncharacterized protein n=1 Tax=Ceratodon purpureus TaxID=3225 RepID=A0A8T0HM70_CERPU|nr:hypothetical protein KC19_VG038900 [Ceratodon purpureus]
MAPSGMLLLPPLSRDFIGDSRASCGRVAAAAKCEDKRAVRFDRSIADSRPSELGLRSSRKLELRACITFAERGPGYGPSASSSSSTNQFSDDGKEGDDKAEGPQDYSNVSNQEKTSMSEEERFAEEQARRRQEEFVRQAVEEARIKKEAEVLLQMSQRAYGRGVYDKSVEMLEAALTKVPGNSNLGGEIQVWLAMAYDAVGRHADCIALYKRLEGTHPNNNLRKQAADLRYIAEAPKLKISRDEMVKVPLIEKDYDRKAKTWSQTVKEKRKKPREKSAQNRDYLDDWLVWEPPRWEKSPYFWVAVTIWLTMVGIFLTFQN